jgi:DNA-binding LacI/PurR family transcriptional regulator
VKVVEACVARETIRRRLPELDGHVVIVGYGDTPWSQAASPTLTTVSYQLGQIAKETLKMLGTAHAG